ncbi:hexose transporter [Fusarium subglutinans]|uniref:Hexose transporter n=1 Tax=Gibberella subglutinans TaxID=42677 RepID=A0A8H5PUK0_GIBSU|nr:hexose transporter [Fusarium subglutinans]KAF5602894.1 hexose transporter [Fusarium subglutinans]
MKRCSEAERERESYKYASNFLSQSILNHTGQLNPNSNLPKRGDAVLTALAQLGACRTNTARSLISIFDERYQHFIAESTPTSPLIAESITPTGRQEDLWLCGTAIPRDHDVCERALAEADGAQAETNGNHLGLPLILINGFSPSDRFSLTPFIQDDKAIQSYAAVPIKTKRGINIGVYCVINTSPLKSWEDRHTHVLRDISRTIMRHLEGERERIPYQRNISMNRSIGALLEQESTLAGQSFGLQTDMSQNREPLDLGPKAYQHEAYLSKQSSVKDHLTPQSREKAVIDDPVKLIFTRSSRLVMEALEVEGCVFLDAATQAFGAMTSPTIEATGLAGANVTLSIDGEDHAAPPAKLSCRVLGFSRSDKTSINGHRSHPGYDSVPEKLLAHLLKKYPYGKIFSFSAAGELQSSDSSGEDRLKQAGTSETPADVSGQRKLDTRPTEMALLRPLFPEARCVAFFPIWNPRRNRWFAGGFVHTNAATRQFSVENELNYLRAFGTLVINEVLRHDMMEDERSKTDALSSLSHELRSPLHGIMLGAELLNDTVLSVMQRDIAHTIEICGRTLLDTLDHLLDFSRINHFTSSVKQERQNRVFNNGAPRAISEGMMSLAAHVRLDRLAEDVIESVFAGFVFQRLSIAQVKARREPANDDVRSKDFLDGVRAEEDLYSKTAKSNNDDVWVFLIIDPDSDWNFYTQPGAVRRIIMNIFGNSLKFTQQGRIKISLKQRSNEASSRNRNHFITITISDTGTGIGQEFLENDMFKPFVQEDPLKPGTGLGLSLVKQIISQLHGRIHVESQSGTGTTITVTLPLARPENLQVDDDEAFKQQVSKLQGLRVRLLSKAFEDSTATDDNYTLLESICHDWLLMQVIAISEIKALAPDLVLLHEEELELIHSCGISAGTPCVVICRNAVIAYQRFHSSWIEGLPIEYVAQPVAPRKLGRTLLAALDRWTEMQHRQTAGETFGNAEDKSPGQASEIPLPTPPTPDQPHNSGSFDLKDRSSILFSTPQRTEKSRPSMKRSKSSFKTTTTFLLVDDNHINLMILTAFSKKMGRPYLTATNGSEAVQQYIEHSQHCKCIFMDISMPVMDGLEATRRIRRHEHENELEPALIIALTGLASKETQHEAFNSGMDLFLTKPVQMKELRSAINTVLILTWVLKARATSRHTHQGPSRNLNSNSIRAPNGHEADVKHVASKKSNATRRDRFADDYTRRAISSLAASSPANPIASTDVVSTPSNSSTACVDHSYTGEFGSGSFSDTQSADVSLPPLNTIADDGLAIDLSSDCAAILSPFDHSAIHFFRFVLPGMVGTRISMHSGPGLVWKLAQQSPMVLHMVCAVSGQTWSEKTSGSKSDAESRRLRAIQHYRDGLQMLAAATQTPSEITYLSPVLATLWLMLLYELRFGDGCGIGVDAHLRGATSILLGRSRLTSSDKSDPHTSQIIEPESFCPVSCRILVWLSHADGGAVLNGFGGYFNNLLGTSSVDISETEAQGRLQRVRQLQKRSVLANYDLWGRSYPQTELLEDMQCSDLSCFDAECAQLKFMVGSLAAAEHRDNIPHGSWRKSVAGAIRNVRSRYEELISVANRLELPEGGPHRRIMWSPTGIIGPFQPKSSRLTVMLLVASAAVYATTAGYDAALMSGINIIPSYTEFLNLNTTTRALNVSANFIGWGIASLTMGPVVNAIGRKNSILVALLTKLFSIGLVAGSQNFAMFLSGRIILGVASGLSSIAGSTWLAETLPPKIRGLGLSITFSVYYVGALISAGITYRTAEIPGEWSWRLPILLQSMFSLICIFCLFLTPESPRWLSHQDMMDEALQVIASIAANGDQSNEEVCQQYQSVVDSRERERTEGKTASYTELFKTRSARRRLMLAVSVAVIVMASGNNIASFFLGDMLTNAGITNKTTQLQINIVLQSWCLVCAMIGTFLMDRAGRKTLCLSACVGMTILMFVIGALTKTFSTSQDLAGIYGTVACIFLFMGAYSVGITPITQLYPPEVLSYSTRTNGMAIWAGTIAVFAIGTTLVFPIALEAISWRLYFIIGAWDVLETIFVAIFWVETKGLSLEEIDELFERVVYNGHGVIEVREDGMVTKDQDAKDRSVSIARSATE